MIIKVRETHTMKNIQNYDAENPLEDILDKFVCHISDFYEDLNVAGLKPVIWNLRLWILNISKS